ncbi:hypothetical protein BKA62DRAFT_714332 [Auriculariales sp. MPI-PUGE-AT-0066]|nr:hypothetical protein BKA62DRAFT_714332 [Auriculariales sp. MPI-PUGE-AT-0066]
MRAPITPPPAERPSSRPSISSGNRKRSRSTTDLSLDDASPTAKSRRPPHARNSQNLTNDSSPQSATAPTQSKNSRGRARNLKGTTSSRRGPAPKHGVSQQIDLDRLRDPLITRNASIPLSSPTDDPILLVDNVEPDWTAHARSLEPAIKTEDRERGPPAAPTFLTREIASSMRSTSSGEQSLHGSVDRVDVDGTLDGSHPVPKSSIDLLPMDIDSDSESDSGGDCVDMMDVNLPESTTPSFGSADQTPAPPHLEPAIELRVSHDTVATTSTSTNEADGRSLVGEVRARQSPVTRDQPTFDFNIDSQPSSTALADDERGTIAIRFSRGDSSTSDISFAGLDETQPFSGPLDQSQSSSSPHASSSQSSQRSYSSDGEVAYSTGRGIVKLSSSNSVTAARAAAILKRHHRYTRDGASSQSDQPDIEGFSAVSNDDLLRLAEAELELEERNSPLKRDFQLLSAQDDELEYEYEPDTQTWTKEDWRVLDGCFTEVRLNMTVRSLEDELVLAKPADVEPDAVVDRFLLFAFGGDGLDDERRAELEVGEWSREKIARRVLSLRRKQMRDPAPPTPRSRRAGSRQTSPSPSAGSITNSRAPSETPSMLVPDFDPLIPPRLGSSSDNHHERVYPDLRKYVGDGLWPVELSNQPPRGSRVYPELGKYVGDGLQPMEFAEAHNGPKAASFSSVNLVRSSRRLGGRGSPPIPRRVLNRLQDVPPELVSSSSSISHGRASSTSERVEFQVVAPPSSPAKRLLGYIGSWLGVRKPSSSLHRGKARASSPPPPPPPPSLPKQLRTRLSQDTSPALLTMGPPEVVRLQHVEPAPRRVTRSMRPRTASESSVRDLVKVFEAQAEAEAERQSPSTRNADLELAMFKMRRSTSSHVFSR